MQESGAQSEPPAASTARARRRRHPILRGICGAMWLGTGALSLALVGAFLVPLDLGARSKLALNIAWTAFMVRTFSFHAAGVLAAFGVLAGLLRAPRLTGVCVLASMGAVFMVGASADRGPMRSMVEIRAMSDGPAVL